MAIRQEEKPVYDERAKEILQGLAEGLTRDELAEMFGHANYKALDIYMRRRNFTWDSTKQTYVPKLSTVKNQHQKVLPTTKAGIVIEMLKQKDFDIDEVCKKAGFKDHRELAEYMSAKGYVWSPNEGNYVKKTGKIETTKPESHSINIVLEEKDERKDTKGQPIDNELLSKLQHYLPLLEMLDKNKEKLLELMVPTGPSDTIPRYIIPGRTSGKTIQMSDCLQDLAVEFCNQRNIKQRELFEVALIEFFKRHGYEYEIESLLRSN
ncbi:hypothetical protein P9850_14620 [Anoxybacillus rupiensis]|uniref:Uncharacterized protein n=1 Tax=Anoxybacteroides rupiense TaxID=311460 RepID=A0ABD5IXU3_9BACL|nr:hypothetical protein [Anoxybacillus rupiensis]